MASKFLICKRADRSSQSLSRLSLSGNQISGSLPSSWSLLPLSALALDGNAWLCGDLPSWAASPSAMPPVSTNGTRLGSPCYDLSAWEKVLLTAKGGVWATGSLDWEPSVQACSGKW